jgi:hypothetical protein
LAATGRLTICSDDFTRCTTSTVNDKTLFSPALDATGPTAEEVEWLRGAVKRSLGSHPGDASREILLIGSEKQPVLRTAGTQYLFGGQFLTVPEHARVDVEIVARLEGTSGWIDFAHNFIVDRRPVVALSERMHVGESLRLDYTVGTEYLLSDVESRMWVTASEGQNLTLQFPSATLSITVLDRSDPVPETAVREFQVSRSQQVGFR